MTNQTKIVETIASLKWMINDGPKTLSWRPYRERHPMRPTELWTALKEDQEQIGNGAYETEGAR